MLAAKSCVQLNSPRHGFINCSKDLFFKNCTVSCKEGYGFPSKYKTLQRGWIECNITDGLWDHQRMHGIQHLPDCLNEVNTIVKVWLSFSSVVQHCDNAKLDELKNIIKPLLIDRNKEVCTYVDCESSLLVTCSKDPSQNDILNTNWTLQVPFNPADFEGAFEVPLPETNMEKIIDTIHDAVVQPNELKADLSVNNIELDTTSFDRGYFVLVCEKEGYTVDYQTKCVECEPGTREENGICVECPRGTFQLEPGQTVCEKCPDSTIFSENTPVPCLDKASNKVSSISTPFLSALTPS